MDLGTVAQNLAAGRYNSAAAFATDLRLTFENTSTFNQPGSDIYLTGRDAEEDDQDAPRLQRAVEELHEGPALPQPRLQAGGDVDGELNFVPSSEEVLECETQVPHDVDVDVTSELVQTIFCILELPNGASKLRTSTATMTRSRLPVHDKLSKYWKLSESEAKEKINAVLFGKDIVQDGYGRRIPRELNEAPNSVLYHTLYSLHGGFFIKVPNRAQSLPVRTDPQFSDADAHAQPSKNVLGVPTLITDATQCFRWRSIPTLHTIVQLISHFHCLFIFVFSHFHHTIVSINFVFSYFRNFN